MARRFTIKEIAHQAGLSPATVDRALHGRDSVRQVTRDRVAAALAELESQYAASTASGARLTLDIVVQAPNRFSQAVRAAFEAELPLMRPAAIRARFHMAERMDEAEIVARLRAIAKRGSQGIVLKVPATPAIEAALAGIARHRIPVVTYVTDVAAALRLAYVGMENAHAGATAAYLLSRMMRAPDARVLVTLSSQMFQGEEMRRHGFTRYLADHAPRLRSVTVSEGFGVNRSTGVLVRQALETHDDISAVYSIGGGNAAILDAFAQAGRDIEVFAAHDLDRTNRQLLAAGKVSFVIHHDFRQDARRVSLHVMKHWRHVDPATEIGETAISIACPVPGIAPLPRTTG
ncbi:LacI family DNA-binding transcriptional regulator [Thetidibacter halocola]|uniref:LacI family DNA-binding transcriptional regulator n=1 Tax=Thetidibacter halocola TaxID=2827239 RepID=A0A8J7WA94_9RHOB|nr:LacI family DNA-binding transcriptional regulator [Thetidibacter halocola]MBS0123815.1 LacI family DNA-binding transcriptional regulator [Thetidibacter halocola]